MQALDAVTDQCLSISGAGEEVTTTNLKGQNLKNKFQIQFQEGALIMAKFPNRLWNLRTAANMSQQELADIINASRRTIIKWEQGQAQPNCGSIIALAVLFQVSTDYLLDLTD